MKKYAMTQLNAFLARSSAALLLLGLSLQLGVRRDAARWPHHALFFLTSVLKVDAAAANIMVAVSLLLATPFFVVFGTLSDKIGRKSIIMAGLLLAVLTYFPLFKALTAAANPDLAKAQETAKVTLVTSTAICSFLVASIVYFAISKVSGTQRV